MRFPIPHSLILLCVVLATLSTGCRPPESQSDQAASNENPQVEEKKTFLTPVYTLEAERGEIVKTIATTGSVVPVRTDALRAEEAGELNFVQTWEEGASVEEGEVIARINSNTLVKERELAERDIDLQEEQLAIGQRTLEARRKEYETIQDLYSRGISARKELDAAKLELDRAINSQRQNEINLEKAKVNLKQIEEREANLIVRAPYRGLIVSRTTLEGTGKFTSGFGSETVTSYDGRQISSGHVVCGIVDVSQVYMRCDVTSQDIGKVQTGQPADIAIYSTEEIEREGTVARISKSLNPDTSAFVVDILVDNSDWQLKPGMFGRADMVVERRRDRIKLPKTAVTRRNNQDVVFIVEQQPDTEYAVAKRVDVLLGLEGKDDLEVEFGVQEGSKVIVRGHEVLQDGTPIRSIDLNAPSVGAGEQASMPNSE